MGAVEINLDSWWDVVEYPFLVDPGRVAYRRIRHVGGVGWVVRATTFDNQTFTLPDSYPTEEGARARAAEQAAELPSLQRMIMQ